MPPSVQQKMLAPPAPAAPKRSSRAAANSKPEGTSFRQELVRQRKEKCKQRDAAEGTKAAVKSPRPQKARKGRVQNKATASDRPEREPGDFEASAAEPTTTEGLPAAIDADATQEPLAVEDASASHPAAQADADPGAHAPTAGAAAAAGAASPNRAAPTDDIGDATTSQRNASELTATAVQVETASRGTAVPTAVESAAEEQDESVGEAHVAADDAEALPEPGASKVNAKPQSAAPVFGQALANQPRSNDDRAGDAGGEGGNNAAGGGAADVSWMQQVEAAAAESEELPEDSSTAGAHANRVPVSDATTSPTIDLSPAHARTAEATVATSPSAADATPPEARFAAANHENIVKGMHAEVLPNGGTMRIRLDPPQLGALQVTVHVRDGVVTAAFETSNDEATRLLGHSLNQLKAVLESHGVGVDKLQVQQAPRDEHANASRDDTSRHRDQTPYEQEHAARQEQQRKEMLRKMWRRLSGGGDPLDVTV